jgi:hypothetical protein
MCSDLSSVNTHFIILIKNDLCERVMQILQNKDTDITTIT